VAIQLLNLRGVPDDEAEEIRALLSEQGIDYYETPGGNWGMSIPALWLKDETQLEKARRLLAEYQQQRQSHAREEYEHLKAQDQQRSFVDMLREHPLRYLFYLILICLIAYISISPFLKFGR
jgi:hypothetical protein